MGISLKGLFKSAVRFSIHAVIGIGLAIIDTSGTLAMAYLGSAVAGEASRALRPTGGRGKSPESKRGYSVTKRGSTISHQIIYGKMKVAGSRIFDGTTDLANHYVADGQYVGGLVGLLMRAGVVVPEGLENKFLHRVIAFTGHEIESFEQIYINDEVATISSNGTVTSPSRYQGKIKIFKYNGSPDQVADPALVAAVPAWTSAHRLRGIAYLYCHFEFDVDAFPNGVPEITAVIKGKKVYDPRSPSAAPAWSDNPALCVRDYLTATGYGLGEAAVNISDTSFITAANICDETSTDAGTTRYTANGAFTTSIEPQELLTDLMTSMGGTIWYTQGFWAVKAAKWAAPVTDVNGATIVLNEDDLRSSIAVSTRHSRRDNFNVVNGTFKGEESNWQVTDFPPVTNLTLATALVDGGSYSITEVGTTDFTLVGATSNTVGTVFTADLSDGAATGTGKTNAYLGVDNGQESPIDLELPWTDNSVEARRIARILLEKSRQQLTMSASFGLRAFQLQTGDNVRITNTRFGWTNKEFEVVSWSFGVQNEYDLQINLVLRETAESVFDEVDDGIVYERDNTTLLSPFEVPDLGINISTELRRVKGKTLGVLLLDINNTSTLIDTAEVQFRKTGETDFTALGTLGAFVGTERVEHVGVEDGFYDIRARATNSLGVHGDFNTVSNYYVETVTAPPADVTNFDGNVVGSNLFLSWTPVSDLDLAHYIIRYSHLTSGAVYSEAEDIAQVPVGSSTLALQNAGVGTYFIKAVDDTTSGSNSSVNPAVFVVTSIGIGDLNVVATLTENPSFAGVKSGVSINSEGYLELAEGFKFDDATGLFDARGQDTDPVGLFDDFTGYGSSGIYYFSNDLDLGQKYTSRLTFSFTSTRFDRTANFDSATGNFDDRGDGVALFDGDPTAFSDTSVSLQLRHTDDDPTGTPTWSDWQAFSVSDITARAFEFRLVLSSTDTNVTPIVSALSATVDMQDRTTSGSDITFTGTTNITFDDPFAATPAIGLSLADLTNGDRYTITNKTRTGFTINTFTGGSASTNEVTLDYVAKGYGKELT